MEKLMAGSQFLDLKAKGLYTFSNPLSSAVPQGSFADVSNVVVDRNEIIEPRRGFAQYGNPFGDGTDRAKQLINYKDVILRHVLTQIQYDVNGVFTAFSGPAINEIGQTRIKSIEANGNLYFCAATGIKKISAKTASDFPNIAITEAGGVKALDVNAMPNYSSAGFLVPNSKVAYRIVWGYRDLNDNLILGSPSSRTVVVNPSLTDSAIVDLSFGIPADIQNTTFFYQVYRTGVFAGAVPPDVAVPEEPADPGDEMYLVFEDNVTSAQLTAGEIVVQDITPEDFRKNGALLYTNPTSGEGIESANEKPPFATDISLYKNYTFYANTKTVQRLNLAFLSVVDFVSNTSTFVISDGITTNTYLFQGSVETYTVDYTGLVITDLYNAAPGTAKYFTLDSSSDERSYYVWFSQSVDDQDPLIAGKLGIKVNILAADTVSQAIDKQIAAVGLATSDFNISRAGTVVTVVCANNGAVTDVPTDNIGSSFAISKDGLGTGQDAAAKKIFLPRVPTGIENGPTTSQQLEQVARSLVSVLNLEDDIVYAYYTSGFNDVPGQVLLEQQDTTGRAFYLNSNQGQEFNPTVPTSGSGVISTNEVSPNRLYYSKLQQPEAVPIANYLEIGPKDREIKRIIALRESLFIFKEDGIYRLSGDSSDSFIVNPFDFSAQVLAADTAVVLNNQIYALSTQGVIQVTDTGVSVISRPIENLLLKITRQTFNFKTASFGVTYETDRSYMLFTVSDPNDTVATQCFRYNTFTNSWTRWDVTKTCGIVNFADDKLYLGAGDINSIEKERKTLTRTDHADREYTLQVLIDGVDGTTLKLNSVAQAEVGDVLIQTQYLTISQFNRLLDKLDRDISVSDNNYMDLALVPGNNMRSGLIDLAAKMDTDPGINYSSFLSDIDSYTYNVASIVVAGGTTVVTTTTPHEVLPTRYVTFTGGITAKVLSVTSNTMTVDTILLSTPAVVQPAVNDFRDMQSCYNIMVNVLNNDTRVFYTNYPLSEGTIEFEVVVLEFNKAENTVLLKTPQQFIFGNIVLYKAINSRVIWNPAYFEDPSTMKQVREGTMIFENANFSKVDIGYGTDLSPSFETITFEGPGLSVGDWGYFNFGTVNWGGVAAPIPLRTYIPQNKQRCRFMNVRFEHKVAFEKYAIYGLSLTFRPYNIRAYR
jgi:hypothetical protein